MLSRFVVLTYLTKFNETCRVWIYNHHPCGLDRETKVQTAYTLIHLLNISSTHWISGPLLSTEIKCPCYPCCAHVYIQTQQDTQSLDLGEKICLPVFNLC